MVNLVNLNDCKRPWPERVIRSKYNLQEYQKTQLEMIGGELVKGSNQQQQLWAGIANSFSGWEPCSEALPSLKPQMGQAAEGHQNLASSLPQVSQ